MSLFAPVTAVERKVYYAPAARKHFMTRRAAIHAEARARIQSRYPTESPDFDSNGRQTYGGWHWSQDERLKRLYDRIVSRLKRSTPSVRGDAR